MGRLPDGVAATRSRCVQITDRTRARLAFPRQGDAGLLVQLISDSGTNEAERNRYLRSLDFQSGPEKDAALLQLLTTPTK